MKKSIMKEPGNDDVPIKQIFFCYVVVVQHIAAAIVGQQRQSSELGGAESPYLSYLCGVCMFFPCLHGLSGKSNFLLQSKVMHLGIGGWINWVCRMFVSYVNSLRSSPSCLK